MELTTQIAKQFREVHFGGNWTSSNLKNHIGDLTWEQATDRVHSFNTIAALVFHMNYYVRAIIGVLSGRPLAASDKYSFDHPPVESSADWEKMLNETWTDAEHFANLVEALPEEKLWSVFAEEKYGTYYRNLTGVIEHIHYHLGQVVLIKKTITGM